MLRAKKKQYGVGDVARQKVGAPALPIAKNIVKHFLIGTTTEAAKKLRGAWRRPGARVEKRNFNFARGEGVVNDRQISDDHTEKSKTHTRFKYGQRPRRGIVGSDVSVPESEESLAAQIEHFSKRNFFIGQRHVFAEPVLHAGKSKNQANRPTAQQHNQR